MNIDFLLIFFVARYLRNSLKMKDQQPVWDFRFRWIMYSSIALFLAEILFSRFHPVTIWVSALTLIGFVYMLYKQDIFKPARSVLIAIAPYAIITIFTLLVKAITPALYKQWHDVLDNVSNFSVLWGIGVWFVGMKQRKELNKANAEVAEQVESNKLITAMKAELEIQVRERTAEITQQKDELEATLNKLKATQSQLIQSEKMASLGELTAGIAHEIQNPLNFVNNFSELNKELVDELQSELKLGNAEEAITISNDIKENEEKINHHGKRADAIVKGMLQHSRASSGTREPTDINALCDEYLRLAYHGLRAKDKSFNATMKTDFDENIGKINIVPQDIGRVILNLLTNAFYAVTEKKKGFTTSGGGTGIPQTTYEPTVSVKTSLNRISESGKPEVVISVSDNGNGIPQSAIDKIFYPFFTTKPTGEGTGLGLSMSYDIITKGHGGQLKVITKTGEGSNGDSGQETGTTFKIILPI